jgi:hypothetical protein
MAKSQQTAADTLILLEDRVNRVNYILNGDADAATTQQQPTSKHAASASVRLRSLERNLHSLASNSPAVADVLTLQRMHPEFFDFDSNSSSDSLPAASIANLILAHSQLYQSLSTRLSQLQDLNVPDAAAAAKLIELRPRIQKAHEKQVAQAKEFAELRARSAQAVEKWYEGGVLGMGEQWAEWEERLRDAEILVRRREAAKRREDGTI